MYQTLTILPLAPSRVCNKTQLMQICVSAEIIQGYSYINVVAHIYRVRISWHPNNCSYSMSISQKYILSFSFVHKYTITFQEFKKAKNTFTNIFKEI